MNNKVQDSGTSARPSRSVAAVEAAVQAAAQQHHQIQAMVNGTNGVNGGGGPLMMGPGIGRSTATTTVNASAANGSTVHSGPMGRDFTKGASTRRASKVSTGPMGKPKSQEQGNFSSSSSSACRPLFWRGRYRKVIPRPRLLTNCAWPSKNLHTHWRSSFKRAFSRPHQQG